MLTCVLFDLDGTLLDTVEDLTASINQIRKTLNLPPKTVAETRPFCYSTPVLLANTLDINREDPHYPMMRNQFLEAYETRLIDKTAFFPGIKSVLDYIDSQKLSLGIVTNKPFYLAKQLLKHFKLFPQCRFLIGGDQVAQKPAPDGLLAACKALRCNPDNSVYIGDAECDIIAANAAKMRSVGALYGFTPSLNDPKNKQADYYIASPGEITPILKKLMKK